MSDRPIFIYAATYASSADAYADYETLLDLHAASLVGTYDVAVITKDEDGKVHVSKHEKPTQHGAWGGIAVGARHRHPVPAVGDRRGGGRAASSAPSEGTCARACREATPRSSAICSRAERPR